MCADTPLREKPNSFMAVTIFLENFSYKISVYSDVH